MSLRKIKNFIPYPIKQILKKVSHELNISIDSIKGKRKFYHILVNIVSGRKCLEIGAFSDIFDRCGYVELYKYVKSLDIVNFSEKTVWENNYSKDDIPKRYKMIGDYFVNDAVNLESIHNDIYDCVISSDVLEHIANPIKALKEWQRITKKGGYILAVVPDKRHTFDHKRNDTTFQHLIDDYQNDIGEDDLYHLDEILQYHDLKLDPAAGNFEKFKQRSSDNYNNRCLHHHVFNEIILREIGQYVMLEPVLIKSYRQRIIALYKKQTT